MDRESLELFLRRGLSLDAIGQRVGRHSSTVSYWLQKYGLEAVNRERCAGRGGLDRKELEALVEAGLSIAQIAREVDRGTGTVRHWLGRYGLKTRGRRRRVDVDEETDVRTRWIVDRCAAHGDTRFVLESRGYYRCARCRSERATERRRENKRVLLGELGGHCVLCGYDRYAGALDFHHLDGGDKQFGLSRIASSLARARVEARKCVILCSVCHAEVEANIARLPHAGPLPTSTRQRPNPSLGHQTVGRCPKHGVALKADRAGTLRCGRCRAQAVVRRRRRVKEILLQEHGGCCVLCGYERYAGALQFHHVEPARKSFSLARSGITRSLERSRAEASKCILVCSNCHAELKAGCTHLANVM